MPERVVVCIGTKKGLFVAEAPTARRSFALRGPFSPGVAVYAAMIDTRGTPRVYASSCNARLSPLSSSGSGWSRPGCHGAAIAPRRS